MAVKVEVTKFIDHAKFQDMATKALQEVSKAVIREIEARELKELLKNNGTEVGRAFQLYDEDREVCKYMYVEKMDKNGTLWFQQVTKGRNFASFQSGLCLYQRPVEIFSNITRISKATYKRQYRACLKISERCGNIDWPAK